MFGLYFSIIGLISGIFCSVKAGAKNRNQKNWFLLGFVIPGISLVFLNLLSIIGKSAESERRTGGEVSFINVF
jgi:F0F1-type ATP synthase assembly protein I